MLCISHMRAFAEALKADDLNVFRRKYFEGFKEFERLRQDPEAQERRDDAKGVSGRWREKAGRTSSQLPR